MEIDNDYFKLQSVFIEADSFYIGEKSHNGKRVFGTDKQAFIIVLGTTKEDNISIHFKIAPVKSVNNESVLNFLKTYVSYNTHTIVDTNADGAYNILNTRLIHKGQVIDHDNTNRKLY